MRSLVGRGRGRHRRSRRLRAAGGRRRGGPGGAEGGSAAGSPSTMTMSRSECEVVAGGLVELWWGKRERGREDRPML